MRVADNLSELKIRSLIVVAILAGLFMSSCDQQIQSQVRSSMPEVATMVVSTQPVVLTTELPGRTFAYLAAEIRPQVNGLIQKRLFTEGSDVKAGQVLYEIDPAPFQAAVNKATGRIPI